MKTKVILAAILILASSGLAQDVFYSIFSYDSFIPSVIINDRMETLQRDLYPDHYGRYSAASDMRWVRSNDSALTAFWTEKGDTVLHILTELSGITWRENAFDICLVRYLPSRGTSNPIVIPLGGMKRGEVTEAAPSGRIMHFNLIFQLARRMLDQTVQPRYGGDYGIAYHPLMRSGPYRRDNLALLLTVATCENVLGLDSTRGALESAFWNRKTPGMEVFRKYLLNEWILTPDRPLADWIAEEPYGSSLVTVTRPPRRPDTGPTVRRAHFVEGLPLKGVLGMTVVVDEDGLLAVDTLDTYRLAYANGLQIGDRIRTVDQRRVRTSRELVERIYESLYDAGATLQILRDGDLMTLILRPMDLLPEDDEGIDDMYYYPPLDSTTIDTIDDYAPDAP